ncbi:hypothetical protein ACFLQN_04275 [Candidatus Aenigmatarchaeota archaeon]
MAKMRKERYIIALLSTSFIFVIGIIVGAEISSSQVLEIQQALQQDVIETQGFELELSLIELFNTTSLCDYIEKRLPEIKKNKLEIAEKFDVDLPEEDFHAVKRQFYISQTRFWTFTEVQAKQCEIDKPRILFFFDDSEVSREQGRVLDYLVYRNNEIIVFAFDSEFEEPVVQLLVNAYNITKNPTIVYNSEKFEGFHSIEEVNDIITPITNE